MLLGDGNTIYKNLVNLPVNKINSIQSGKQSFDLVEPEPASDHMDKFDNNTSVGVNVSSINEVLTEAGRIDNSKLQTATNEALELIWRVPISIMIVPIDPDYYCDTDREGC